MKKLLTLSKVLSFLLIGLLSSSAMAAIWYVDSEMTGSGDGTSWATAFQTIQEAVDAAVSEDEIWVKKGVYVLFFSQIEIAKSMSIYGGFTGTETQRNQRNWNKNETVVDGLHKVRGFYITADAANVTVDGFSINNGNASSDGAGIYNAANSSLTIANCTFNGNSASSEEGGIYNADSSTSTITNCTFNGNSASSKGGGIYNDNSTSTITNCTFNGNSASNYGGGIYNYTSSPIITNCTFNSNSANNGGGGIYNYSSSSPIISNSIFWNNGGSEIFGGTLF